MKLGVIAGNFDVIHPGYMKMFKECKQNCDKFLVFLHSDPTIERPEKIKPILSVDERIEILNGIKYIDEVIPYNTEQDLWRLLILYNPSVRFLGEDYKDKNYTGKGFCPVYWINRDHGWSTTKFRTIIMKNISLERKVEVYEAVLRKLNAYGNLMIDHTKMRELMVALNEYEFSKRDGEKTEEEWEVEVTMAFEKLAKKVGL